MTIDREWERLSYALSEIESALGVSEIKAFDHLRAWVVDGKIDARGPWPAGPGTASIDDTPTLIPAHEFDFAERCGGERVFFMQNLKTSPLVQIRIKQVRAVLDINAHGVPPKNRGGRPFKADWMPLKELLKHEIDIVGFPHKNGEPGWQTIADVATWLGKHLSDNEDVSTRTLRTHAKKMIDDLRRELGRN